MGHYRYKLGCESVLLLLTKAKTATKTVIKDEIKYKHWWEILKFKNVAWATTVNRLKLKC